MAEAPTEARERDELLQAEADHIVAIAESVGHDRLGRSRADILITAFIGGVEVSLGGLAAAAVVGAVITGAPQLGLYGGLAIGAVVFPVGFVFVLLGRSELFTENFLIPVVSVIGARPRRVRELLELWSLSWIGNLAGCAVMAALLNVPDAVGKTIVAGLRAYTAYKLDVSAPGTFVSAMLAGITMTILTWLIVAVRPVGAKIAAIVAAGYVLFATNLSHAIVGAAVIFAGFHPADRSVVDVLRWLGLATFGNLTGGVGFVTAFRVAQAREKQRTR